ncbi:MAG: hypothetical protein SPI65_05555 [Peptoniphilus sp.]|nr:hypothetical protein [Peptoniphilus sp.]MDD7362576.1 hypothetical protein [Bacillota bacterium]MDY6045025.1 hypothetical protein [Peptoniphilus sp.]
MRGNFKKGGVAAVMALILVAAAVPTFASGDDPLVSLSYLNQRLQALEAKIDGTPGSSGSSALEVVDLKSGDRLIAAQGTELIPRSGKVSVIAGELGGLSDITSGDDLKAYKKVSLNHLLIAPRSDGRGLRADTNAIVMVRGSYHVEK